MKGSCQFAITNLSINIEVVVGVDEMVCASSIVGNQYVFTSFYGNSFGFGFVPYGVET